MKSIKNFIVAVAIPLIVGGLSAFLTRGGMQSFEYLDKPALTPPAIVFAIVWTVLYILMGIASYLVYTADAAPGIKQMALTVYGVQLFFNFFWPILFFGLEAYLFSFIWLVLLWFFILLTQLLFYAVNKTAAYLLIPYAAWVAFAGYLNLYIYIAN